MTKNWMFLLTVALCACGTPGPMDSGTDANVTPPGDGGMPDTYVPPGTDGGMPDVDAFVPPDEDAGLVCTSDMQATRVMGCGELYDLPTGMPYDDDAMLAACMTTLNGTRWARVGSECPTFLFREDGTDQWLLGFSCSGAVDLPYSGVYRLGAGGTWYGNYGNADLPGEAGNHGRLIPSGDCTTMMGEFYRGGETVPYQTYNYWMM